jgi:glutamate/aspartate transport system substrate-binding protein
MKKHLTFALMFSAALTQFAFAQSRSTFDRIKESGVVNIGVRESGGVLSFALGQDKYAGFHVELCERIVSALSKQLERPVSTRYQLVTGQNRIPLVQNGTVDLECGTTTNNAARQKDVGFLNTTFVEEVRMATRKNSGINSIAQLGGKTVVTTTGTTGVQHLRRHARASRLDFKVINGKDAAESFLMLDSGRADALVTDAQIIATAIATSKLPNEFHIVGETLNVEPIAIMLRKDDVQLRELGNRVIKTLAGNGELEQIWKKWFLSPLPGTGANLKLVPSQGTRAAWAEPNDKPVEEYSQN